MFIKIVVVLLLLIVVTSLLAGRTPTGGRRGPAPLRPELRIMMLRVAIVLLVISAVAAVAHLSGWS